MESLNWKQSVYCDDSIKKTNIREYSPHTGTNLNDAYSDIHIEIQNQDQFLLPGDSYIYIEAQLTTKSGAESFGGDDDIGLINNGVMYLFDRIGYKVNEKEIEGYSYPGVATKIKGILTYPKYYPQSSQFAWLQDRGKSFTNVGNKERRKLMRDGHFSVAIPLSHIFGFCEYYKNWTYGYKHTLTLRRNHDNDAIIKSDSQEEVGGETRDKVLDGSIVINKLS